MPIRCSEHLARHLPGAEAGHPDPVGEVVRRVLDGVVHLARGHLDGQTNAVTLELLELGLHRRAIESGTSGSRARRVALRAMDVEEAIRTRRTHKVYEQEPVDRATVEELLELARWAPNHHLTEPWRFRVLGPGDVRPARRRGRARTRPRSSGARRPSSPPPSPTRATITRTARTCSRPACAVYIVLLAAARPRASPRTGGRRRCSRRTRRVRRSGSSRTRSSSR